MKKLILILLLFTFKAHASIMAEATHLYPCGDAHYRATVKKEKGLRDQIVFENAMLNRICGGPVVRPNMYGKPVLTYKPVALTELSSIKNRVFIRTGDKVTASCKGQPVPARILDISQSDKVIYVQLGFENEPDELACGMDAYHSSSVLKY